MWKKGLKSTLLRQSLFQSVTQGDCVTFAGVSRIYVNPADSRGRAVLATSGVTQPLVSYAWRHLLDLLKPTLVLDIGANYGEIALSVRYGAAAAIILLEANPALIPWLAKSISSHANAAQITAIAKLAGESPGQHSFFVDHKWSGTSSALGALPERFGYYRGAGAETGEYIIVDATTVDNVTRDANRKRLLFKIDVEGFEAKVLSGMAETLAVSEVFAGIVEFDKFYLRHAGINAAEFLSRLKSLGPVHALSPELPLVEDVFDLPNHCDLILVSRSIAPLQLTIPDWIHHL